MKKKPPHETPLATDIPSEPTRTPQKPPPYVIKMNPVTYRIPLPPLRLIAGWPWEKSRPKKVRSAQVANADFSQLSYIGVPAETDAEKRKQNPDLSAVDYIRAALQVHNRLPVMEAAKVYSFSNLVANKSLVGIIQVLQDRARKGDLWAKQTLREWGSALGAAGKGKTSIKTKQQQRKAKADSEHVRRIKKQTEQRIEKHTQKLVEGGTDKKTALQRAKVWRLSTLQEDSRIKPHRIRRVLAKL